MFKPLVTPHCHPQSLDSGSTPEAFIQRELELGTGYVTCTDHGFLGATRKVYDLAHKAKIKPILGMEGYFRPTNCDILKKFGVEKTVSTNPKFAYLGESYFDYVKYMHFTAHFLDEDAFQKGSVLLSASNKTLERHGSEEKPIWGWEQIEELGSTNTTLMSGCLIGIIQRHLMVERPDIAKAYYERFRSLVKPGNFAVEIFPHSCDRNWVQAVFFKNEISGIETKYHLHKTLRIVDPKGKVWEGEAQDFAKKFVASGVYTVVNSMYRKQWQEMEPVSFHSLRLVEDFVQNECTPLNPEGDPQLTGNRFVLELAKQYGDPVIVSDDSHYAHPDDKIVQDVRLLQSGNWRFYGSYHRKSSDEAFAYFKDRMGITKSEFEGWVENSRNWASRFDNFKFKNRLSLPSKFYPSNTLEHLESLIEANGRMDYSDPVKMQRVKDEIELLHSNGVVDLLPYFFAQEDVLSQYEKAKELVGPGRGSAAGLYISYLLNITHVDPLRYELSKDRFLTKDRILSGKLPDIDVDLPSRDLLVGPNGDAGYLKERFGDHFAQISNDNTLRIKSSIKDVYRALHGNVPWEIEKLCKQIPIPPQGVDDHKFVFGYEGDDGPVKGIAETDPALKAFIAGYPKEWAVVVKCLGITRNKGRHASAFVLANEPVANFLPLIEVGGTICTAYDHRSVESAGGLKMDYLVIHVLNDIAGCIKLVQTRHTPDVDYTKDFTINGLRVPGFRVVPTPEGPRDIWDLPGVVDVFNDICSGKVATVFQFDTPGVTKWMKYFSKPKSEGSKELGLSSIEDLAAFTALDRPGPLDAEVVGPDGDHRNMLVEFASRTQGGDPYGAIEELDRLLPETKGVMVYQEQLTKIFRVLGKTTALEAEAFREHVSKKKMELVLKDKSKFMAGAGPSLGEERANLIWDQMVTFARYGFNKSHAISYVCIAYATAYLKHFYNLEWWTSVLANAKSRNEINEKFWSHVQNLVLLPDVKYSKGTFVIEGDKIRAPLSLLEGVGEAAHLEIVKNAPYENIADFVNKIEQGRVARGTEVQTTKKKKIKKVDGTVETVSVPTTTFKKGRTAINKTVISNLIISGVADGLFPPDTDIFDKMQLYEQARAVATGTKPKPIPPALLKYTPLMRYQVRKKLLQGWSGSLLKVFLDSQVPQITKNERGTYIYRGIWPFVTPDFIDYLETLPLLPKRQNFCVAAYVVSERKFTYQGDKTACELILDVSGRQMKMVKWPDYNSGKLPVDFNEDLTNALVVVMLSKWKLGRDPSVEGLTVVQRPIDTVVFEEESENNEPN